MFNALLRHLLYSLTFVAFFAITSCSPNQYGSKYSSSPKRQNENDPSRGNKSGSYVYKNSPKKETRPATSTKSSTSTTRENIIFSAQTYIGSPYKSGGKSPTTGFDCSGFTGYVFTKNGFPLSGPSHDLAKKGNLKSKEKLQPGDLVFFGSNDRISHVAIVSDVGREKLEVIHSTTSAGVKKDNILGSEYWEKRYLFGVDILTNK
ncbi:MAG: C40 family peptidase [Saprospiraceae bacterium]